MIAWRENLLDLGKYHNHFAGSVTWALRQDGVHINRDNPVGTPGLPLSVRRVWSWFWPHIRASAIQYDVPVELIVMILCTENIMNARTTMRGMAQALRHEPGYKSDAETPNQVSAGCMQTLLSTAREALGTSHLTVDDLFDPATSIAAGTAYMASQFARTAFDPPLVAADYNAGGVYINVSVGNRWKLQCYPIGTGEYVDRTVTWFNDAMRVAQEPSPVIGEKTGWAAAAPSFGVALSPASLLAPVLKAVGPSPAAMPPPPLHGRPPPPTADQIAHPGGPGDKAKP